MNDVNVPNLYFLHFVECNPNLNLYSQAHKVHISLPGRKKDGSKKQAKKTSSTSVPAKNQANLKK